MGIDQLDAVIRICTASIILLLAWLMFRDRQSVGLPATVFAPLAVCLSAFVVTNTPQPASLFGEFANGIAHFLSGFTVTFLWWFCLSCFDSRFHLRGGVLAVGVVWTIVAALDRGLFGNSVAGKGLSVLLVAMGFGIVGHLIWRLIAERSGDLIQSRHDARIRVAVLLGGMLLLDLAADTVYGFAWRPLAFAMTQNAMILAFALWLAKRLLATRPNVLTFRTGSSFETDAGTLPFHHTESEKKLRRRLSNLIETQRIHLDPDLTFAAFVEQMGAPERTVRKLINHDLGFDHFRVFLNHYRVAEARRLLGEPDRVGVKLITIAFDSGFASLASFNRVFRAMEGCSPGEYRSTARHVNAGTVGSSPTNADKSFESRSAGF